MKTVFVLSFFLFSTAIFSQGVEGVWLTIDDQTGKPKSHVKTEIRSGKLHGTIQKVIPGPGEDPDPLCDACKGDLHGKKVLGMNIIYGLTQNSAGEWEGRNGILDPESGNVYTCKIWLEDANTLKVRGYVGFFFRTQTWQRVR